MPAKRPTLTAKQAAFAREYVVDCNATAAAIRAGYSARTASQQSYDLIRNPAVAAEIERLTAEKVARSQITADEILMELAHIARADMGNVIAWGSTTVEIDADTARKIFRLIDALEDSDDVQNVFSNFDLSADVQAELEQDE